MTPTLQASDLDVEGLVERLDRVKQRLEAATDERNCPAHLLDTAWDDEALVDELASALQSLSARLAAAEANLLTATKALEPMAAYAEHRDRTDAAWLRETQPEQASTLSDDELGALVVPDDQVVLTTGDLRQKPAVVTMGQARAARSFILGRAQLSENCCGAKGRAMTFDEIAALQPGDTIYECERGLNIRARLLTVPQIGEGVEGRRTLSWTAENTEDGEEIAYLWTEGMSHYGPRLYLAPQYGHVKDGEFVTPLYARSKPRAHREPN